ncbi:uracil-DNA glycosylase [Desulfobacula sp.]|uniref:uracil-DNA glycosylase n=1 Tax=Desulfobacula sp. TaxID=2593537 RepID=UPI00261647AD|nr:uracil-DNA glycosylase [Desulfobacula sp.]
MSNDRDSIKTDLISVINDFSLYLSAQRKMGNTSLGISKPSEALINNWGMKSQPQTPFFFEGPENASIFILDSGTRFFKGPGGELLIKILAAMTLSSDAVFICNAGDAIAVHQKIDIISPKVIITLGTQAGQFLLKNRQPLEQFRGRFHDYHGIKVMPTFHPSLLLKHPEYKRQVWEDMKRVMAYAGLKDGS